METRVCRKCNEERTIDFYGKYRNRGKEFRRKLCNPCRSQERSKQYYASSELKERAYQSSRKSLLKNRYGITEIKYEEMLKSQHGRCGICKKESSKKLNIDHNHKTNVVRGLLCWDCNIALGKFKDNLNIIKNAVKYMEEHHEY